MKKNKILILLIGSLLSFSLPSCSVSDSKINLRRAENVSHTFLLSSKDQLNAISRYEDALIFVTLEGCHYCENQRELFSLFIENTHTIIYETNRSSYLSAYDDKANEVGDYAFLYPTIHNYPAFLFYKEGKLKDSLLGSIAQDYSEFVSVLTPRINLLNYYCLNDYSTMNINGISYHYFNTNEDLDEAKSIDSIGYSTIALEEKIKKDKATVLYTWRRCSDCKSLRQEVLYPFSKNNSNILYYYEVDGYYLLKRSEDETLSALGLSMWASFCNDFSLYNDSFYYIDQNQDKAGVVPTIVTYENGVKYSMNVYLNEGNIIRNDDGTISFTTYFNEEIKEIKSSTKVEKGDISSSTYQKAYQEIYNKAKAIDITKTTQYLSEVLA